MLREESSISDEVIAARGYRTITDPKELTILDFSSKQVRVPGLLLPLHTTDSSQPFCVYRPDSPRVRDGKAVKYEMPAGQGIRLDCPPSCRVALADQKISLFITEGQKKADALASRGACAIALLGVWNFKGKNSFGGVTLLADFDHIALNSRDVRIVFDNDVMRKSEVRKALERLTAHLQRKGAHISAVYLPLDGPKGVDEFLASGKTLSDLEALIEGPRPQPTPAPATIRLLDHAPLTIQRPLSLIDGRAYVATWLHVEETRTEATDKAGNIVKLNPPQVTTEQRLFVVRDDGHVFGDGGDETLDALLLTVKLPTIPLSTQLWQAPSVNAYRAGARPEPHDVFARLIAVYNHYLDFDRSFSEQTAMCNISACLSLMTWFTGSFDVLPYPWPNGEWGRGKTKWGTVWALSSYLGQILTWSGSFAALRDLADYGATLLLDDAENIDDPKSDPDKRALLLAGNRRGAMIPLKEPNSSGKGWSIRWVNAFCPRGFTAKKRPYGALETRSLVIPLVRSADKKRANCDPIKTEKWPCNWRQLQDDLWATALMLLPEAVQVWNELDQESDVFGRSFEVWRAPLAVARLFERHGVQGLEETIRKVMTDASEEKLDNSSDYATKVVEILATLTFGLSDVSDVSDDSDVCREVEVKTVSAKQVSDKIQELTTEEDDLEWATPKRIGWIFNTLRLPKKKDTSTKKNARLREVTSPDYS